MSGRANVRHENWLGGEGSNLQPLGPKPSVLPVELPPNGTPNGIRTRVTCVKGRRPRPLDDGGLVGAAGIEPATVGLKVRYSAN
jgi:hypothetical protein